MVSRASSHLRFDAVTRMRTNFRLVLLWILLFCALAAVSQQGDVAVVVNPVNPVNSMTMSELRKVFAGEKRSWANGQAVRIFIRSYGTRERITLLKLLGMSESEYKQYWTAQVFRGEAQVEPVALPSNGMQKEAVATFPGAIVLVAMPDVKPGMKVIKVNGHLPGEAGYPLH
jgi:ABC-type phosphate transport system substrate-binding protein